jgi:hypothetical protein
VRILVSGGRAYRDSAAVDRSLRKYINPGDRKSLVIEGGGDGLDRLVRQWCWDNGVHHASVRALWDWYQNPAGPIRNGVMLTLQPEFFMPFPGNRGTRDMTEQAEAASVPFLEALI